MRRFQRHAYLLRLPDGSGAAHRCLCQIGIRTRHLVQSQFLYVPHRPYLLLSDHGSL